MEKQKLLGRAYVLTASHDLMGDAKDLAERVWDLSGLEDRYLQLEERIEKMKKTAKKNKVEQIKRLKDEYFDILQADPYLPHDLLPSDWAGTRVKRLIFAL